MKKIMTALLTMALFISAMAFTVSAEESSYNGFVYSDMGEEIYIIDYVGTEKEITVPATIAGKPVTQVYTTTSNDTVTSITLEEGIRQLGHAALMDYTALQTVNLPSTIESLGQSAIIHAPNVKNVFVADGCENYIDFDGVLYERVWRYQLGPDGQILFDEPIIVDGYGLRVYPAGKTNTSYTVLDTIGEYKVVEIAERAFSDAKNLKSIVVPESVNRIWYAAFEKCENLTKLVFYNMKHNEVFAEGLGDEPEAIFGYYYDEATGMDKMAPMWVENIAIYCYKDSDIDQYATFHLDVDDIHVAVTYLDNLAIGESDDVLVTGKEENAIETGTKLAVFEVKAEQLDTTVKAKFGQKKYTVLDISLLKNGVAVQPIGKVTVSIALPEGYDSNKCKVYHIATDGTVTDMNAVCAGGKISFDTDHFSQYAIVEGTIDSTSVNTGGAQFASPNTGDMSPSAMWMAIMLVCGVAYVAFSRTNKRA